jgi:hypothetical protein
MTPLSQALKTEVDNMNALAAQAIQQEQAATAAASQLASVQASVTTLTAQNQTLTGNLTAANAKIASLENQPTVTAPRTINVAAGSSINAAVKTAHPGDTISIAAGTYSEQIDCSAVTSIRLIAAPGTVIIDGKNALPWLLKTGAFNTFDGLTFTGQKSTFQFAAVMVTGDWCQLYDITASKNGETGMRIAGNFTTVVHCDFSNNGRYGYEVVRVKNTVLCGCTIHNNNVNNDNVSDAGGSKALYCDFYSVIGCTFIGNNGPACWCDTDNSNVVIRGCYFSKNQKLNQPGYGAGIMLEQNKIGPFLIDGCITESDDYGHAGIDIFETANVTITNSTIKDQICFREMADRKANGYVCQNISITSNQIYGSVCGLNGLWNTAADLKTYQFASDGNTYHKANGGAIGYLCNGTQTTLAQMQALGLEAHGVLVTA